MSLNPRRSFIALASDRFESSVSFYQQLLGQTPQPWMPQRYAEFQIGDGLCLAIFSPKPAQQAEFASPQPGALSLCLEVADLAAVLTQLQQLQCPHGEILQASHGQEVYAYDPQGNRIILYQPNRREAMEIESLCTKP